MKSGVRKGVVTTFSLLSVVSLFAQHGETSGPNIVMFLIDDLGWNDFGCYGSKFYQTPTIDRLARSGILFTDAYAACTVCLLYTSPSPRDTR